MKTDTEIGGKRDRNPSCEVIKLTSTLLRHLIYKLITSCEDEEFNLNALQRNVAIDDESNVVS